MALSLVVALAILGLFCLWHQLKRPANYPPGPKWLPFMGNMALLRRLSRRLGAQHLALVELSRQHKTPVLGLKLGGDLVVVVSTHALVHEVLTREEFEGRPDTFFIKLRSMGTRKGVTCTDGEFWRIQRSFVVRHLRQLGYGKLSMEDKIIDELNELTALLQDDAGASDVGVGLGETIAPSVLNVLWSLTAGARFARDDIRLNKLLALLAKRGKAFDMAGGTLNQLPWLRFIAPERTGFSLLTKINHDLRELLMESIDAHKLKYSPDVTNDLIDAFLHQMSEESSTESTFTESQLVMVCLDLFIAGSQTTSNTLDFAFLLMLLHPDVQQRVQEELDSVIGKDRLPNCNDIVRLPFTEAVLMECQRFYHVTPIIGPRRVLKNTKLHGYDIPKNTTILISMWSIHMDKTHWGDPDVFRPDRFIDSKGELITDDWLLPFGLGKRRCLGEVLAKSCIFLFFTGILQKFVVSAIPGEELHSRPPIAGITLAPMPYKAVLTPRA